MISLVREATFSASHIHGALPGWHECARPHPRHDWTITLEASSRTHWSDDESVAIHAAYAEFEAWAATLTGTWLNDADESLHERCDAAEVARWVYAQWADRVPYLAAVRVGGPLSGVSTPGWPPRPRRVRAEVEYRPPVWWLIAPDGERHPRHLRRSAEAEEYEPGQDPALSAVWETGEDTYRSDTPR